MTFVVPRKSHLLALVALAALLLLLLARLPPSAPPAPRSAPLARFGALVPLLVNHTTTVAPDLSAPATNDTTPVPPLPSEVETPSQTQPQSQAPPQPSQQSQPQPQKQPQNVTQPLVPVVYTRDVYVAGHERPHSELCPGLGARLRLLILVTSAPAHSLARDAVRLTWGHYAKRSDISLAFVLGTPKPEYRAAIDAEDALYGDIIIGNSDDSYSNLTLKTLSMLEWVDTYCPRVPRLLKTDDDMFINIPKLLEFMAAPSRRNATNTIWGKVIKKSIVHRSLKNKYYISPLQFPGKIFPDFATGPAYLLTVDTVGPLLAAAPDEPYLRLEDVFVTGVLASRLGIRRVLAPEFYNKKMSAHPCNVQRGIAIHMVRYHEQFDLWRKLLDGKSHCTR